MPYSASEFVVPFWDGARPKGSSMMKQNRNLTIAQFFSTTM